LAAQKPSRDVQVFAKIRQAIELRSYFMEACE